MPQSQPPSQRAPVFQDAWTPPDGESEMETGALSEDAFQMVANSWPVAAADPRNPAMATSWSAATSEPRNPASEPHYNGTQERPWDAPRVSGGLGGRRATQPGDGD
jgi:hypothetical protein